MCTAHGRQGETAAVDLNKELGVCTALGREGETAAVGMNGEPRAMCVCPAHGRQG